MPPHAQAHWHTHARAHRGRPPCCSEVGPASHGGGDLKRGQEPCPGSACPCRWPGPRHWGQGRRLYFKFSAEVRTRTHLESRGHETEATRNLKGGARQQALVPATSRGATAREPRLQYANLSARSIPLSQNLRFGSRTRMLTDSESACAWY